MPPRRFPGFEWVCDVGVVGPVGVPTGVAAFPVATGLAAEPAGATTGLSPVVEWSAGGAVVTLGLSEFPPSLPAEGLDGPARYRSGRTAASCILRGCWVPRVMLGLAGMPSSGIVVVVIG